MPRTDRRLAALALGLALLAGPGCSGASRTATRQDRAVLVVRSPVTDAVLWVDGRYVAQLRDLRAGVTLTPGLHQIELRHDRYHPYYGEVELAVGQRLELEVALAERFP
jgi:hypothetical protein